jgi:hypothetical protein
MFRFQSKKYNDFYVLGLPGLIFRWSIPTPHPIHPIYSIIFIHTSQSATHKVRSDAHYHHTARI